jgi:hypothetical protein
MIWDGSPEEIKEWFDKVLSINKDKDDDNIIIEDIE